MTVESSSLIGNLTPLRGRRPKTNATERVCAAEFCATRLSRYNRSDRCFLHQAPRFPRVRNTPQGGLT
ncbi:MAG: hypothetical protein PVI35_05810 [Acidimicrobiia bacterium]